MWRIVHSPFGLHLRSLRDNPQKAEYLGVRVRRFRLAAFAISGGLRGGRRRHPGFRTGLADPELVYWTHSGHLVFMTVLGGFYSFLGPIAGALGLTLLQDQLQSYTQYWRFVLGAILAAGRHLLPARARRLGRGDRRALHRRKARRRDPLRRESVTSPPPTTKALPSS